MKTGSESENSKASKGWLGLVGFALSCMVIAYVIGIATARYRLFPYPQVENAANEVLVALDYGQKRLPWQLFRYNDETPSEFEKGSDTRVMAGLTLVSAFTDDEETHSVAINRLDGTNVHEWNLDWASLWPDQSPHIPQRILDRDQKHIHGVALADNGDIIFNFSELAMFRVNPCGELVWRLDKRTHHSIDLAEDGSIWVSGIVTHYEKDDRFPNHDTPFEEFTILHVSAQGDVIQEISLNELFLDNKLSGLLYLSSLNELTPIVKGDTLHVNDVVVFPTSMPEGVFKHGDIMVSLRNINTVLVFDPKTLEIRFVNTGYVLRQHDTDFVDGNTISIFDNNNQLNEWFDNASGERNTQGQKSLISTMSAPLNSVIEQFDGGQGGPFFTDLMGAHQRLSNGNIMIVEARVGRMFEVTSSGELVWEYFNRVAPDMLGAISYAERLPLNFDEEFFQTASASCQ